MKIVLIGFGIAAAALACTVVGCKMFAGRSTESNIPLTAKPQGKIAIVYYSQSQVQNTALVAKWIKKQVGGDLIPLELVKPYPEPYGETLKAANAERAAKTHPQLKPFPSLDGYDIVFVGAPIWYGTYAAPLITFWRDHPPHRGRRGQVAECDFQRKRKVSRGNRDRGDCENNFDEYKNQWGWCGFVTQKIKPTRAMARLIAIVANWWNVFCRLAEGGRHMEAVTSRPMLMGIVGRIVESGRKRYMHLTSTHAEASGIRESLERIGAFLGAISATAPRLGFNRTWIGGF